jgi:hypothetical protein
MSEERDLSSYGSLQKDELIDKIIQLQQTLQDLTMRIEQVRDENQNLKDENLLLKEYINNLMVKAGNLPASSLQ